MRMMSLLVQEILHRKLVFVAGVLVVALSVGAVMGSLFLLRRFDRETESIVSSKEEEVARAWARYKNDVRKSMLELGFNLIIVHKEQQLSTPDAEARYLPEEYAPRLAAARMMTINHVLPFLQQKLWWPERKRWITLYGTSGETQINNPASQAPLVRALEPNHASLGHGIHESLGLKEGDRIVISGREFVVQECRSPEGFLEDEQLRIPLRQAQMLLDLENKITGIMAISCFCDDPEGLSKIRRAVSTLLPWTQVREHRGNRVVRAEERSRAAREAEASLARERAARAGLRLSYGRFQSILVPLVIVCAAMTLGLTLWVNLHQRRVEIAILRAIGWPRVSIVWLFLGKATIIGMLGGVLGCAGGSLVAARFDSDGVGLHNLLMFMVGIAAAVCLAVISSWVPALFAYRVDPARVLQEE